MEFQSHLKKYLSDEEISNLRKSLELANVHGVLLNPQKMSDQTFLSLFPNVVKHSIVPHAYIYKKEMYNLGKSIFYDLGCFYLQEPSAMIPSFLLAPDKDDVVLDLCAAPGGKTIHASFLMEGRGLIVANDISRERAMILLENVEKIGLPNVVITNNDFQKIQNNYQKYFTKIILDAPCSGSGMFRKLDEMKNDWSYNKVLKYKAIQESLILSAYDLLAPGGIMVYSTCSFSFEENEEVIDYLLKNRPAEEIEIEAREEFYKARNNTHGIHLFPSIFAGEGHYICLIKKPGNIEKNPKNSAKVPDFSFFSDKNHLNLYGDTKFFMGSELSNKGLNIIRYGLKYSTLKGKEEIFAFHLARALTSFPFTFELNQDDTLRYLKGESIYHECAKGMVLLTYENIPLGFGKSDGKTIKNHYPKHLRRKF